MAPGSPAANGEIQLESEVNNPVWEKTREFQRERGRGKPIGALHREGTEKEDYKRKRDCRDPPTDPVPKCTTQNQSTERNSSE